MCYHMDVPLLLRLTKDIEENPGPTTNEIIAASETDCVDNSGKQRVAMALASITYSEIKCERLRHISNNII